MPKEKKIQIMEWRGIPLDQVKEGMIFKIDRTDGGVDFFMAESDAVEFKEESGMLAFTIKKLTFVADATVKHGLIKFRKPSNIVRPDEGPTIKRH